MVFHMGMYMPTGIKDYIGVFHWLATVLLQGAQKGFHACLGEGVHC